MWKRPLEMNKTAHISVRDFRKSDFTKKPNKAFSFFNILPNFMGHKSIKFGAYAQIWATVGTQSAEPPQKFGHRL